MEKLSEKELQEIIHKATVEKEYGAEYIIHEDSEDFYMRYDFQEERVTDTGLYELTGDQVDKLIGVMQKQYESDLEEEEEENEHVPYGGIDYYKEFGLDPSMFI